MEKFITVFRDNLKVSWQMIVSHKLRSLLSMTGVVFGILTLLVTLAIGEGTRQKIMNTIEAMGVNLVYVSPKPHLAEGEHLDYNPLTLSECDRLDQLRAISAYAPILNGALLIQIEGKDMVVPVDGVTASYQLVRDLALARGRFVADEDVARSSKVAVLGHRLAGRLFPEGRLLGRALRLWDSSFRVIGILEEKGRAVGTNFDDAIFIPLTSLQEIQGKRGEVQAIWICALDSGLTKEVMTETRRLLGRPDLEIWDQAALLEKKDRLTRAFKWALGAIALMSLLVGGIGIMNVLLVSVAERVKEIGVRKAVGATSRDILLQFIFESSLLSLSGAALGILLGLGLSNSVAWLLNVLVPNPDGWQAVLSWGAVQVALQFSFWTGLVFGLYPAWKASHLDPCEALIYQ